MFCFRGRFSYFRTVITRFFRLAPSIWFLMVLSELVSYSTKDSDSCLDTLCSGAWWKTFLNIQNTTIRGLHQCLIWTWYVASEIQLSFIAPLFIYVLKRWKIKTLFLMSLMIIGISIYRVHLFFQILPDFEYETL